MKKLNLLIEKCSECPYSYYDSELDDILCKKLYKNIESLEKVLKNCPLEEAIVTDYIDYSQLKKYEIEITPKFIEKYKEFMENYKPQFPTGGFVPKDRN
jgi:hypothetical protein